MENQREVNIPFITLNSTGVDEYCLVNSQSKYNGYWWYMLPKFPYGNYSKPFQDRDGGWWFQVSPGLIWSAQGLNILNRDSNSAIFNRKLVFAVQFPVENNANSNIVLNMIDNLPDYTLKSVDKAKVRALRKASDLLSIEKIDPHNKSTVNEALNVWNTFVERTRWKWKLKDNFFRNSWTELSMLPGATILGCFEKKTGQLVAWLIVKLVDEIAYIDTIASHSNALDLRPNDYLIYTFLMNAKQNGAITKAHYSLKSYLSSLEKFKQSLGFRPISISAYLRINPFVKTGLKLGFPSKWNRLNGSF